MPNGALLPAHHHVLRYCFNNRFAGGQISPANFTPRLNRDEGKLSTVWVECCNCPEHDRTIDSAKKHLFRQIKQHDQDKVCCLQVDDVSSITSKYGPLQTFEDWGSKFNKRHTSIRGLANTSNFSEIDFAACAELARFARKNLC